ncbi:MAG: 30S ribosomal protein S17 [Planctomycetota bacterium]|jgi:small subunit ribosomal protein S17|nr:30S ribosomal protein S17 [Planctomycetota bacterium]|tara:strand:- start:202 stop:462 length:261 start_codon:yes stop_codon:yes gene_type:complete
MPRAEKTKSLVGVVSSNRMQKSATVEVERLVLHPVVQKYVKRKTKFHVHDEEDTANIGDTVRIIPTRPISKTKNWKLVEVVTRANI